jgi:polysaccharide biosynthesis protein PslG
MPQTLLHTLRVRLPARLLVLALAGVALLLLAPVASAQPTSAWRLLRVSVDNAGSLTATPATVLGGSSGNTLTLRYSAAMRIQKAAVKISVPDGWSAPSKSGVAPGYVTASAGAVSITDRTILVSGFNFGQKGGTITVTFGSKAGGGPGAASPALSVSQLWQGSARSPQTGSMIQIPSPTVVVSAPVVAAPPPPAPASTTTFPRFGIAAGGNIQNLSAADLTRDLDMYKSAGSRWARIDINWQSIQRGGPASYDWAPFDRVVQGASSHGLKVLATILYTPAWARPAGTGGNTPPTDLSTYSAFARAAVQHFAPMGVHTWEIWNEPNIGFWAPAPDPVRYTQMLKLAYPAIKQADPTAFVVSAGLSPYGAYGQSTATLMNPLTFLERMYAAGAAGSFDALGWHPYNFTGIFFHPASAWSQVAETTPSARSMMVANGDSGKQIWGTEFGAPTGTASSAVSEASQAQLVKDGYAKWKTWSFAGPLFWYSARDQGTNSADREDNFGLVNYDYAPKPSFSAFQAVVAAG